MKVKNGLSSPCSVVDAEAIASLLEVKFPRNIPSCEHKTPENLNILISGLRHIDNRLSRHDEKVCGGLRVDVLESDAELIAVHHLRRNLPRDDFFKQCQLQPPASSRPYAGTTLSAVCQ